MRIYKENRDSVIQPGIGRVCVHGFFTHHLHTGRWLLHSSQSTHHSPTHTQTADPFHTHNYDPAIHPHLQPVGCERRQYSLVVRHVPAAGLQQYTQAVQGVLVGLVVPAMGDQAGSTVSECVGTVPQFRSRTQHARQDGRHAPALPSVLSNQAATGSQQLRPRSAALRSPFRPLPRFPPAPRAHTPSTRLMFLKSLAAFSLTTSKRSGSTVKDRARSSTVCTAAAAGPATAASRGPRSM